MEFVRQTETMRKIDPLGLMPKETLPHAPFDLTPMLRPLPRLVQAEFATESASVKARLNFVCIMPTRFKSKGGIIEPIALARGSKMSESGRKPGP